MFEYEQINKYPDTHPNILKKNLRKYLHQAEGNVFGERGKTHNIVS